MSTIIRAVIPGIMLDVECVEDTLKQLQVSFSVAGDGFVLANGVSIKKELSGLTLSHRDDVQVGSFVEAFSIAYRGTLERKIAALRLQEARLREAKALREMSHSQRVADLTKVQADRKRLENTRTQEAEEMRRICAEKAVKIRKVAEARGFAVREEIKGHQRVLVLVRRSA